MEKSPYAALYECVMSYLNDDEWDEAYELLKGGHSRGDGNATAILAEFFIHGVGVPEDMDFAIELLEQAISRGCVEAADTLGSLYLLGEKVPLDEIKGVSYIRQAADMGDSLSMGKLANAYMAGHGVPKDYVKAYEWGIKAAELGDRNGIEIVAMLLDAGHGVERNIAQAAIWYRKCLQMDPENEFYISRLALCLADPFEEMAFRPDSSVLKEAYHLACKGVEKGDLDCYMLVAWFYEMGDIVPQDYNSAYKYMKYAADNGHEMSIELVKRFRKNIFGGYYIPQ